MTPTIETATAPHLFEAGASARRMMQHVLMGLAPVIVASVWFFRFQALLQIAVCLAVCAATEAAICRLRGRAVSLGDRSVAITALLLACSLPPRLPLYASIVGAVVAVALGKMAFGGLGHNIFNPAMVGRAFLMVCFPAAMTQWASPYEVDALSGATPLAAFKFSGQPADLASLCSGAVGGSLGETSAAAILLGGAWVLWCRAGDWRLTAGMFTAAVAIALADDLLRPTASYGVLAHLTSGGFMLGAFFIVTDPVTSPLSKRGRWLFGLTVGSLTMIIRLFAGYPEGVMFSILLANALTPLFNRWALPIPVGGKTRHEAIA